MENFKISRLNFILFIEHLLHEPDSIKTGTKGRELAEEFGIVGILTGVDLARAPTSIDSISIWANEFL